MAYGQNIENCWCMDTGFSAAQLIEQYLHQHPQISLNKQQCLCRSCLDNMAATQLPSQACVHIYTP